MQQATSTKRDTSRRRQQISLMVREAGSVQVASLASHFKVSTQTIRKDLLFLETHGIAQRAYGGAIAAQAVNFTNETPIEAKRMAQTEQKSRIGALAATMIQPGDSIVLDSGTTTLEIARHLTDDEDITVFTNDLDIINELAGKSRIVTVMLGGTLRRRNRAFYGPQTQSALEDLHIDKLFLGVDGFDIERGITTLFEPEAVLNRRMVSAASKVIAVTDASKFGRICLHRIMNIDELDALVTDMPLSSEMRLATERLGVTTHVA